MTEPIRPPRPVPEADKNQEAAVRAYKDKLEDFSLSPEALEDPQKAVDELNALLDVMLFQDPRYGQDEKDEPTRYEIDVILNELFKAALEANRGKFTRQQLYELYNYADQMEIMDLQMNFEVWVEEYGNEEAKESLKKK